ncbi:MAG: methylenetetrahydrofolate reductase [Bacteroidaceae bacterium]|jgi:methylenetetrahydrofolate reductase (NADPH)|nr:methylenetetrahydrofolate reductase [NAD(P)H] [Bacteroidaceae bacterium]
MKIMELLAGHGTAFTFEVLPPVKGAGIATLKYTIEKLLEFAPKYINITNHRSEPVYRDAGNGLLERAMIRRRPGTIAVAAALQNEYKIPIVPHILCSGFTKMDTEYVLMDLQFLGVRNLLLLRGDKGKEDKIFKAMENGYSHATELIEQVNQYNNGYFVDGTPIKDPGQPFSYGVACYPEKHEEAPNLITDIAWFKKKVDLGAEYGVTQMFFDNQKYFDFVKACREEGITVPIIPGIKPLTKKDQLTMLPRIFHCDLPEEFVHEAMKCSTDEQLHHVGIEWCIKQCKELMAAGVPSIHFYSSGNPDNIYDVAKAIY